MSEVLSSMEIEGQRVELLPARTVLSVFLADGGSVCPAYSQTGGGAGLLGNGQGQLNVVGLLNPVLGGGTGNPGSATANAAC